MGGIETSFLLPQLLSNRYSGTDFDDIMTVSPEHIESLKSSIQHTPSCFGEEPWVYVITQKSKNFDAWNGLFNSLVHQNQKWAVNCDLLIAVCARKKFTHNKKENDWYLYDTGASAMVLVLMATHLGLMSHQMGGFDPNTVVNTLEISGDIIPISVIGVGHAKETSKKKPKLNHNGKVFFDKYNPV